MFDFYIHRNDCFYNVQYIHIYESNQIPHQFYLYITLSLETLDSSDEKHWEENPLNGEMEETSRRTSESNRCHMYRAEH